MTVWLSYRAWEDSPTEGVWATWNWRKASLCFFVCLCCNDKAFFDCHCELDKWTILFHGATGLAWWGGPVWVIFYKRSLPNTMVGSTMMSYKLICFNFFLLLTFGTSVAGRTRGEQVVKLEWLWSPKARPWGGGLMMKSWVGYGEGVKLGLLNGVVGEAVRLNELKLIRQSSWSEE